MRLAKLRAAASLADLAALLGFKPSHLAYVAYGQSDSAKYTAFEIPKASGGVRVIFAPAPNLRLLQRRLANVLQDCLDEILASEGRDDSSPKPDRVSHGFRRRRSIATNAWEHRHRRYVLNVDLSNFFETITFPRVRGYFLASRNFQLETSVATIIAHIACHKGCLPQGSPCSPVISNLIGRALDIHLVALAARKGVRYSRYADDLTFSTNKRSFPPGIAAATASNPHNWIAGRALRRVVLRSGFAINDAKTRMQYFSSRQTVTGLVVNRGINTSKEYRRRVRAMTHRLCKTGSFHVGRSGAAATPRRGNARSLHGMLGFVHSINQEQGTRSHLKPAEVPGERTYRRFLMFKYFYAADSPVVVCEGKTDTVYLAHAFRSLATTYPKLAERRADGEIILKIRRFRYTRTSTCRLLKLNGGSGDVANFIGDYLKHAARFEAPGPTHPVIILTDNDKGAPSIFSRIKQIKGADVDRTSAFTAIAQNLYLVLTPLKPNGKDSCIEDLFDDAIKKTLLDGRPFDPKGVEGYGKADFAYRVVEPNAGKIDFSGFAPLLNRFVQVLDHHEQAFGAT